MIAKGDNMDKNNRIVLVVASETGEKRKNQYVERLIDWCEFEGCSILVLVMIENHNAVIGAKGMRMINELIERDLIDGVVALDVHMFNSAEGKTLLTNINRNNKFLVSYLDEITRRKRSLRIFI